MHVICLKKVTFLKVTNFLKALVSYTAGYCQLYWDNGRSRAHLICEVTQQECLQFRAGTATDTLGSVHKTCYAKFVCITHYYCLFRMLHKLLLAKYFFNLPVSLFLNICLAYKLYPWKIAHTRIVIKYKLI